MVTISYILFIVVLESFLGVMVEGLELESSLELVYKLVHIRVQLKIIPLVQDSSWEARALTVSMSLVQEEYPVT